MNMTLMNKKRILITLLSLFLSILLISGFVVLMIFYSSYWYVVILAIIGLLGLLYCLSKFLIYKMYLNLKCQILKVVIEKKVKAKNITLNKGKEDYLYHFYSKKGINIKSFFDFCLENDKIISLKEFEIIESKNLVSNKVTLAGKHIRFKTNKTNIDCVFILNHNEETEKYKAYFSYMFQNTSDFALSKTNKQYVCMYNDKSKLDTNVVKIFDKISLFHMLCVHDGIVDIIFLDKTMMFDFKLQKKITEYTISLCEDSYDKFIRLINLMKKEEVLDV